MMSVQGRLCPGGGVSSMSSRVLRRLSCGAVIALLASLVGLAGLAPSAFAANPVQNNGTWKMIVQGGFINLAGKSGPITTPVSPPQCNNGVNDTEAADSPGTYQTLNFDYPGNPNCASATDD